MKPVSSSTAYRAFSRRLSRGTPSRSACEATARTTSSGNPRRSSSTRAPLSGMVAPAGNKNGALPLIAASLLTEDELVLRNVPRIADVEAMIDLVADLGATVDWRADNELAICGAGVDVGDVSPDRELSERIRASFLLAGPLLARFGPADTPPPRCAGIGRRRLAP